MMSKSRSIGAGPASPAGGRAVSAKEGTAVYINVVRDFVTVARVGELTSGRGIQVTVDGRWVGLFNVDGQYYAVDNLCLHRGGPLSDGPIAGCVVTCPWHGWQYDVTSGALVQEPRVGVTKHEARVVGDEVQVRLGD